MSKIQPVVILTFFRFCFDRSLVWLTGLPSRQRLPRRTSSSLGRAARAKLPPSTRPRQHFDFEAEIGKTKTGLGQEGSLRVGQRAGVLRRRPSSAFFRRSRSEAPTLGPFHRPEHQDAVRQTPKTKFFEQKQDLFENEFVAVVWSSRWNRLCP